MTKQKAVRYNISIGLVTLAIFFTMPYFWMLFNSFKSTQGTLVNPRHFLSLEPILSGYEKVLIQSPFSIWFRNSILITVTNTAIILFTSTLVGYALSKFQLKYKRLLFTILLVNMMVPAQITMTPSFLLINSLGLYSSAGALTLPSFINAFGIYLCKQFCDGIPREPIESVKLDGVGDSTILRKITILQIRPVFGTLATFILLNYWNDYLNPLTMLSEIKKIMLPLALFFSASQHMANLSVTMVVFALIMVSVIAVFVIFQEHFIRGIVMTGMK